MRHVMARVLSRLGARDGQGHLDSGELLGAGRQPRRIVRPLERAQRTGAIPPQTTALTLPAATLQRYVGQYQLPIGGLTVAMADGGLTAQLEGQDPIALEALSETEFRPRGVGARIVFTVENGAATRVTLRQNGHEVTGQRLPPR